MTQLECELRIMELLEEAYMVMKQYNPAANQLTMFANGADHHDGPYFSATGIVKADGKHNKCLDLLKTPDGTVIFDPVTGMVSDRVVTEVVHAEAV